MTWLDRRKLLHDKRRHEDTHCASTETQNVVGAGSDTATPAPSEDPDPRRPRLSLWPLRKNVYLNTMDEYFAPLSGAYSDADSMQGKNIVILRSGNDDVEVPQLVHSLIDPRVGVVSGRSDEMLSCSNRRTVHICAGGEHVYGRWNHPQPPPCR